MCVKLCVAEPVRCHHVDMYNLKCSIGMQMIFSACVFILFSAALVSVQTVINIIICCTYMADTSHLSQRGTRVNLNKG